MIVKELCDEYINEKPRSPYSIFLLRSIFDRHVIPFLGHKDINQISIKEAREYLFLLENKISPRTNQLLAQSTKASLYRNTICLFNFAIREGYIQVNPFSMLKPRFKESPAPIKTLSKLEAMKLLGANYRDKQLKFCVYVSLCTGLRRGEILALRWSDIDLVHRILYVNRAAVYYNGRTDFKLPKNNKKRHVPICQILYDFLLEYKQHDDNYENEILSIKAHYLTKWFTPFVKKTLGSDISFKGLRKTFGSLLLQSKTDILDVSYLLGHSTVTVTEKSYLGINYKIQQEAVNKLYE